jgi:WD40 repeat protein
VQKIEVAKAAQLTGHRDCVYTLERTPDDSRVYSAGADGMVVSWSLEGPADGQLVAQVPKSVYAIRLLADQELLLVGQNFAGLHALDLEKKEMRHFVPLPPAAIFDIQQNPQTGHLYVALGDGHLFVVDGETFSIRQSVKLSFKSLRAMAFHPETNELAVASSDHLIRILDPETLEVKYFLEGHTNSVFTVAFSPDGKYLLSGSRDAHLRIWDCHAGYREQQAIVAHLFAINHLTFSPDGKHFASCSLDKTVKIGEADTFRLLKVIDRVRSGGHATSVNKLFWSTFQNRLVSCSDDRTLAVWDLTFGLRYENNTVRD